jgi:hypothetical protein
MAQQAEHNGFTPRERTLLSQGYAFAYLLHPVKAIAREITIEAWTISASLSNARTDDGATDRDNGGGRSWT